MCVTSVINCACRLCSCRDAEFTEFVVVGWTVLAGQSQWKRFDGPIESYSIHVFSPFNPRSIFDDPQLSKSKSNCHLRRNVKRWKKSFFKISRCTKDITDSSFIDCYFIFNIITFVISAREIKREINTHEFGSFTFIPQDNVFRVNKNVMPTHVYRTGQLAGNCFRRSIKAKNLKNAKSLLIIKKRFTLIIL